MSVVTDSSRRRGIACAASFASTQRDEHDSCTCRATRPHEVRVRLCSEAMRHMSGTMARIRFHVYASLRQHTGGAASVEAEFHQGETIQQVLLRLGIPAEQVPIVFVNNRGPAGARPAG